MPLSGLWALRYSLWRGRKPSWGNAPAQAGRSPRVELRLAGAFAVVCDGFQLPPGNIGGRKARTLLKFLVVMRPALVTADQIAEVRWEDDPPATADRNVATLISRLRAVPGPGGTPACASG